MFERKGDFESCSAVRETVRDCSIRRRVGLFVKQSNGIEALKWLAL